MAVPAQAQPGAGRTYVSFGDSFTAGPNYDLYGRCPRLPFAWPSVVAAQWPGASFGDHSCSGATIDDSPTDNLSGQVDEAMAAGDLGPGTELVTIQIGGNDSWSGAPLSAAYSVVYCLVDIVRGCDAPGDPGAIVDAAAITPDAMVRKLTAGRQGDVYGRIRRAAPNARIAFVGYPTLLPDGPVCVPVNGFDGLQMQPRSGYARLILDRLQDAQRGAAERLGAAFWDLRAGTAGHDVCRPVDQRWITRAVDFHEALVPFHPTVAGHAAIGGIVTAAR